MKNNKGKIYGAILAGGSGRRMKISDLPKQFLMLEDRPIIIHTLEKFLLVSDFEFILVGINPQWKGYFEDLLKKYFSGDMLEKILVVEGGESRSETIDNIINYIDINFSLEEEDILVTHDAVRPFVSLRIIAENIELMEDYRMVDTVIPAQDTIVVSSDGRTITDIPLRSQMYQGQTPQSFKIVAYKKLYDGLSGEERELLTDACKVFILRGEAVGLVRGDESNLKITTVKDLKLARAILGEDK